MLPVTNKEELYQMATLLIQHLEITLSSEHYQLHWQIAMSGENLLAEAHNGGVESG